MILNGKTFLIASFWCYPFGGGEEYLYQTAIWMKLLGANVYWISFADSKNQSHTTLEINQNKYYISIDVPGGFDAVNFCNWLRILKPDIVHHQGHLRKQFAKCCEEIHTEFISGIHFWNGAVCIENNVDILQNVSKHKADPDLNELIKMENCTLYSVSDFVTDCIKQITGIIPKYTIYSGSLKEKCEVPGIDIIQNTYVTMINIHKLKGGNILLQCMRELPDIPFIAVQTEHHSEDLDTEIQMEIDKRNMNSKIPSFYFNRMDDIRFVYSKTKILLVASLVDETFCRTANEAMMNGICVLTSGKGNLGYMIDDPRYNIGIDDTATWVNRIREIYYNENLLLDAHEYVSLRYQKYSEDVCQMEFINMIKDRLAYGRNNNIMIFCPWCDQGLGIQSKNYYQILRSRGYNVSIFSFRPYNAVNTLDLQKNPNEWKVNNVYYSSNTRENVTDAEILSFIKRFNISKCLLPETCWHRVFEIARLLEKNGIKCYAIPNIEIVRKDEMYKHTYFHKILCNNHICEKIFNNSGISNTQYIGYAISENSIFPKAKQSIDTLKFLFIGGMNAFSRKHILEICEAFKLAVQKTSNIQLTCTIQKTNDLEKNDKDKIESYNQIPEIHFINEHQSYEDILNLYYDSHISIQVSKHEGLGLGFYESLASGTPVITLNTAPHNEIIEDTLTGWLINCQYKKMSDNPNAYIESAYFEPKDLANKIVEISEHRAELKEIYSKLQIRYFEKYNHIQFSDRLINAINL